jgi:hypothetical protein
MSVYSLLERVSVNTEGRETSLRVIGSREPPAKMTVQIAVSGNASVRVQGRISKDAPWTDLAGAYAASALAYIEPIPFLRAVASEVGANSSVSVWATWAW